MASVRRPTRERAFKAAIKELDEPLFKSKGIHITAGGTGREGDRVKIALRDKDNTTDIARLNIMIYMDVLELDKGWTPAQYQRQGYGTIIRALVCKVAKDLGYKKIQQISAAITKNNLEKSMKAMEARRKLKNAGPNNNIENLKKAASWRPDSAYIMNKLGFQINNRANVNNQKMVVYTESRTLHLNTPTPKLNAVVRGILNSSPLSRVNK